VHEHTVQWAYVVSGKMVFASDPGGGCASITGLPGDLICEPAGVPHAWRAVEDTTVLVFTRGPRSGEAYETDTQRLSVPLLP
jgi:quercetin dioxygenase-like cupin family protein